MRSAGDPIRTFSIAALIGPILFLTGMLLYFMDRSVGEAHRVEEEGVVGLAANLSLMGLTAAARFVITFGPQLLILVSIALPVVGALYALERYNNRRRRFPKNRRVFIWCVACSESMLMLGVFVAVMEVWHG